MARKTVDGLQSEIAALVDQDENTGNISSTDYSLRLKYLNMALLEWAEVYDWQVLYTEFNTLTSTSTGNASISLPSNFRKSASYPYITFDGAKTEKYPETRPQESGKYLGTDRRVEYVGNPQDGYTMVVYGGLVSGASIKVPYYRSIQSLASPANVAEIPNPDYLVKRAVAYLWEAREDARFVQAKQDAELILRNMIEYENVFSEASTNNRVSTVEESKFNFRIGRN